MNRSAKISLISAGAWLAGMVVLNRILAASGSLNPMNNATTPNPAFNEGLYALVTAVAFVWTVLVAAGAHIWNRRAFFDGSRGAGLAVSPRQIPSLTTFLGDRPLSVPGAIAALLLLAALGTWPAEYFVFARWVVLVCAAAFALYGYVGDRHGVALVFAFVALLFNPLVPVYLLKEAWVLFGLAGAALFIGGAATITTRAALERGGARAPDRRDGETSSPESSSARPDRLRSLHDEEESLRVESLARITRSSDLASHLLMIRGCMELVLALVHDHVNASEDELTVQLLGTRLFNSTASALKLALSGYCQSAFTHVRDAFETTALLDYMRSRPDQIAAWKNSDAGQRKSKFGPRAIREALDLRDGFEGKKRQEAYGRICEYAAHPTAPGFRLLTKDGLARVGPFLDAALLKALIEETASLLVHGTLILSANFEVVEPSILLDKAAFVEHAAAWRRRYFDGGSSAEGPT
jgi:hypothetical protein